MNRVGCINQDCPTCDQVGWWCVACGFRHANNTPCDKQQQAIHALVTAARATLTEQRREFARGDVPDLDRLEDALKAFDLAPTNTMQCEHNKANKYGWGRCRRDALDGDPHNRCEQHAKTRCSVAGCEKTTVSECPYTILGHWYCGRELCEDHACNGEGACPPSRPYEERR